MDRRLTMDSSIFSTSSTLLASLDVLGLIGGKWKKRVRFVFINTNTMQETVHFELETDGFGLKTHQKVFYELIRSFTVENFVICTQKLDWLPKWGKLHHKLVVCHTRNKHSATELRNYLSFEKDTEGVVVQCSTKEDDVKLFKWRKDSSLTIKEERRDLSEYATLSAGNQPLEELFYILIQEMEKPYHLQTRNCQQFVNTIISKLSPRRESIKRFHDFYSQQNDNIKKELDKDITNIKSMKTASKELVNDVFDFLNKELNADEKLLKAIESIWSLDEIKEKLKDGDPNAEFQGKSIFMIAVIVSDLYENPTEIFDVLRRKGINVNARDNKGNTIVHHAVKRRPEVMKYIIGLVGNQSDLISMENRDGDTPLHVAVKNSKKESIEMLIEAGCDQGKRNRLQLTPAELAVKSESIEHVNIKRKADDQIEQKSKKQKTESNENKPA